MNPQTQVSIFKYFSYKGLCNKVLCNIGNDEDLWEGPNHFFCMKKKEKKWEKTFSGENARLQGPYGNSNIFFAVSHIRRGKYLQSIVLLSLLEM